jgi:hypothetical protein
MGRACSTNGEKMHIGFWGSIPGLVKWDLWWTKWHWGRFSPSTSVSPCQPSLHQLLHNHPHLSSGAGTTGQKWPQYKGLSPTPLAIKKTIIDQQIRLLLKRRHIISTFRYDLHRITGLICLSEVSRSMKRCRSLFVVTRERYSGKRSLFQGNISS